MAKSVQKLMTSNPCSIDSDKSVAYAAKMMRDEDVVRALAEREPQTELLTDERTLFLAAFDDSTPIGFVLAYVLQRRHGDHEHLFVYEIGVRADVRRSGVGTALMQRLAGLARERGLRDAFLLTNESNAAAMAFYAAIGGVRPNADDVLWDLRF